LMLRHLNFACVMISQFLKSVRDREEQREREKERENTELTGM